MTISTTELLQLLELLGAETTGTAPTPTPAGGIAARVVGRVCVVRSAPAGVFYGRVVDYDPASATVAMEEVRRVWKWAGAATLSELATAGPSKPAGCKITAPTAEQIVGFVSEIIPASEAAIEAFALVSNWDAR